VRDIAACLAANDEARSEAESRDISRCLIDQSNLRKGGIPMKAAMVFSGSGPILILTTYESLEAAGLVERLAARGIKKYIAYEVDVEKVKRQYGTRFSIILGDLSQTDDLRVMDIDGHHVFHNFSFEELGPATYHTGS
jgi:hypothetical protein